MRCIADKREFIKISQAVGVGFVVMGTIGYFVKLSTWCTANPTSGPMVSGAFG